MHRDGAPVESLLTRGTPAGKRLAVHTRGPPIGTDSSVRLTTRAVGRGAPEHDGERRTQEAP